MFKWLRKDTNLYSPIGGRCMDIESCLDETFSSKMLGDGYLVIPNETMVCSPCNGTIMSIFPTKHAIGIEMENGKEVMVHIGIDTVKLKGTEFESYVKIGDKVKKGRPMIRFSEKCLNSKDIDMAVLVIMIGENGKGYLKEKVNESVDVGDRIISYVM